MVDILSFQFIALNSTMAPRSDPHFLFTDESEIFENKIIGFRKETKDALFSDEINDKLQNEYLNDITTQISDELPSCKSLDIKLHSIALFII